MNEFQRHHRDALAAWQCGNWALVESCAGAALKLKPSDAESQRLLALAMHQQGRSADALQRLQKLLRRDPSNVVLLMNQGSVLAALGQLDEACSVLRRAARLDPGRAAAWYNLGKTLRANALDEEALPALQRAVKLDPRHWAAHAVLGDALKSLGDSAAAADAFRSAIAIQPVQGHAWWALVNLKVVELSDAERVLLQQSLPRAAADSEDRIQMQFALAWALDAAGKHESAFEHLQQANAAQRRRLPWDRSAFSATVDATLAAFPPPVDDAAAFRPPAEDAATATSPMAATGGHAELPEVVFIVSLPRAGSTLVEQILAAHPQVNAASELPDLPAVIAEESARRGVDFPHWVGSASAADWRRLGQLYLERTRRWQRPGQTFTDKLPQNFLYVGAAMAMLPGARVVAVHRDARDTLWSCYQQYFARGQAFSYELRDIAAFLADYQRLDVHWARSHPQRYSQIAYEALVEQPESAIRSLLARLGLPFDPACLCPHLARRAVRTASAAQVREPMDRRGIGRSAPYAALLAQALGTPQGGP